MAFARHSNLILGAIGAAFVLARPTVVDAFVGPSSKVTIAPRITTPITLQESTSSDDGANEGESIESYLQQNYPLFESLLLSKIPNIYGTLRESDSTDGFTIFCPSNSVMENIDSGRKVQISDPRNVEVTEKLASYHVMPNGKVTQERLKREDWTVPRSADGVAALSIGGVLTVGGELRVGRSKSGGFMGFGAKEDGGVVIGNNEARVVKSTIVGNGVVHEVDGFVAPDLIWRYFDQLRIPGF
mmetsp:Transcript_35922/g.86706  ORF Transcript_35922/g.86706 Transcript_35922/m.86706 type:complete len:243 (+) Transcript_35922:192-920(+)